MPHSLLGKSLTVSLLVHAGFLGLLLLLASRPLVSSDTPLRVRILEPPPAAPPAPPRPAPQAAAPSRTGRQAVEQPSPATRPARPEGQIERIVPRPIPVPDEPQAPPPPPAVASRPVPEPVVPPTPMPPERPPGPPRDRPALEEPEPSGLSLGGSVRARPTPPAARAQPSPGAPARPSLREQIASLGSGLTADAGGSARQTVDLNSREGRFVDYLSLVKRRIERIWTYPEEALRHGVGGELLLVFTLNKAGSLTNVRLVHSSGFPVLDEEALRAVKLAAPYDPFPPQLGEEPWNISASFHYNLPRRFRRN